MRINCVWVCCITDIITIKNIYMGCMLYIYGLLKPILCGLQLVRVWIYIYISHVVYICSQKYSTVCEVIR